MPGVGLSKSQRGEKAEEIYETVMWELVFYFHFHPRQRSERKKALSFFVYKNTASSPWPVDQQVFCGLCFPAEAGAGWAGQGLIPGCWSLDGTAVARGKAGNSPSPVPGGRG